jgi:hypothetical protein
MGKVVDLGALVLQNENTRAVGNMSVNARGDRLNAGNQIIDKKSNQIKRQQKKQTISSQISTATSNAAVKRERENAEPVAVKDDFVDLPAEQPVEQETVVDDASSELKGGLAAAIAKAKTVQQNKLQTPKEAARSAGVRKL